MVPPADRPIMEHYSSSNTGMVMRSLEFITVVSIMGK